MKKMQHIILGIFVIFLLLFIYFPNEVNAVQFEFTEEQLKNDFYFDLNGEWHFFEKQLLSPAESKSKLMNGEGKSVTLPDSFQSHTGKINSFGTYSTMIHVPHSAVGDVLAIHVPYQYSAYTLYVNNQKVAENGIVGTNEETHEAAMYPKIGYFTVEAETMILTMHISSFEHIRGGFENSIYIGTTEAVAEKFNKNVIMLLFMNGSVFIIGLFMALFGIYRRKENVFLIFGIFAILISVRALFTDPFYYKLIFVNLSWLWGTRLEYILTEACSLFYVLLMWKWHEKEFSKKILYGLIAIQVFLIIVTLVTTPFFFQTLFFNVFYLAIPTFFYLMYVVYKSIYNQNLTAKINLIGIGIIFIAFFNDFAIGQNWYQSVPLMLPAVAIYVIIHVLLMSKDFADRARKRDLQNKELLQLNKSNETLNIKLQKEMKQKDDFLANTSHELRNPLHGIISITQSLLRNYASQLSSDVKDNLTLQLTIAQHMSQTLKDLLDITLLKEGKVNLQFQRLDIQTLATGVIDMLKVSIENHNIVIKVDIPDNFPHVIGDENRLIQIMFNLIHNAIKFTEEGTITVSAHIEENEAHIHVTDTGVGIDEEMVEAIFEPYERVDSTMTAISGGIGLGLAVCKQLVEKHNGSLFVKSVLGEGSTFTFTLPLAEKSIKTEPIVNAPTITNDMAIYKEELSFINYEMVEQLYKNMARENRPRILAVDDDSVNLQLLINILSKDNYEIKTVTSGKEALKQIHSEGWDLVITDVMMPTMSGYELTREIRKKFSIAELPILLLTARGHTEDIYTGFLAGANDYVIKPVDAIELIARVYALTDVQTSINEQLQMEAAWLQAQMRPHFLLNTLNAIVSLSEIDSKKMIELIEKFAQYLQSSYYLKNINKIISIKEEIELVKTYLYIEHVRFGDRLQIKWELDEFKNIMVPPLSIQTLVENAVNHGVLQKASGGTVTIRTENKGQMAHISIIDNGVGMDEEQVNNLLNKKLSSKSGIGLLNTNKRLKRLHGNGLTITSEPNIGTTVSFKVPLL